MGSLHQLQAHRRRSQSACTLSASSQSLYDNSWKPATKRSQRYGRPFTYAEDTSVPHKWDVDSWRRGKRRRRDLSSSSDSAGRSMDEERGTAPEPLTPVFAMTSADFDLFPKRQSADTVGSRCSDSALDRPLRELEDPRYHNLSRLRSNAFWELQRSVEESGEGLVQRMRDYEHSRSRSDVYLRAREAQKRGRKRSSVIAAARKTTVVHQDFDDEDDDVQIFVGDSASTNDTMYSSGPSNDADYGHSSSQTSSSPQYLFQGQVCDRNTYHSDDDLDYNMGVSRCRPRGSSISSLCQLPPPSMLSLSHTPTVSTSSSFISLPFSLGSTQSIQSSKAIAALSLAMANGAGSLSDYQAILSIQTSPTSDALHVGEMWH